MLPRSFCLREDLPGTPVSSRSTVVPLVASSVGLLLLTRELSRCEKPSVPRPPWSERPCPQTRGCHILPPWILAVGSELGWLWRAGANVFTLTQGFRGFLWPNTLTVVIIVQLHGEVDFVGENVQVLHEQEELPDEQHWSSFGVFQRNMHLHLIVPVIYQKDENRGTI